MKHLALVMLPILVARMPNGPLSHHVPRQLTPSSKGLHSHSYEYNSCKEQKEHPCLVTLKHRSTYLNDVPTSCAPDSKDKWECGVACDPQQPLKECLKTESCVMAFDQYLEEFSGLFLMKNAQKSPAERDHNQRRSARFICIDTKYLEQAVYDSHGVYNRLFGNRAEGRVESVYTP